MSQKNATPTQSSKSPLWTSGESKSTASSGMASPVRLPRPCSVAGNLPGYALPTVASRLRISFSTDKIPDDSVPLCCRYSRPVSPLQMFINTKHRRSKSTDASVVSSRTSSRMDHNLSSSRVPPTKVDRDASHKRTNGGIQCEPMLGRLSSPTKTSTPFKSNSLRRRQPPVDTSFKDDLDMTKKTSASQSIVTIKSPRNAASTRNKVVVGHDIDKSQTTRRVVKNQAGPLAECDTGSSTEPLRGEPDGQSANINQTVKNGPPAEKGRESKTGVTNKDTMHNLASKPLGSVEHKKLITKDSETKTNLMSKSTLVSSGKDNKTEKTSPRITTNAAKDTKVDKMSKSVPTESVKKDTKRSAAVTTSSSTFKGEKIQGEVTTSSKITPTGNKQNKDSVSLDSAANVTDCPITESRASNNGLGELEDDRILRLQTQASQITNKSPPSPDKSLTPGDDQTGGVASIKAVGNEVAESLSVQTPATCPSQVPIHVSPPQSGKREDMKPAPVVATVPDSDVDAYRAKIAEKRRLAREKADREAEDERIRLELLQKEEEERQRKEEEEEARREAEEIRQAEEFRAAEQERFQKLVAEEQERKEREEQEKIQMEKQKLEKERQMKQDAERLEAERLSRMKRDEEDKTERKKRLESIMKRVKTDEGNLTRLDAAPASSDPSPVGLGTAQSPVGIAQSPVGTAQPPLSTAQSPVDNRLTADALLAEGLSSSSSHSTGENIINGSVLASDLSSCIGDTSSSLQIEAESSNKILSINSRPAAAATTISADEQGVKFKSPLLQQMLNKRTNGNIKIVAAPETTEVQSSQVDTAATVIGDVAAVKDANIVTEELCAE